jgi:hypothetical protein
LVPPRSIPTTGRAVELIVLPAWRWPDTLSRPSGGLYGGSLAAASGRPVFTGRPGPRFKSTVRTVEN